VQENQAKHRVLAILPETSRNLTSSVEPTISENRLQFNGGGAVVVLMSFMRSFNSSSIFFVKSSIFFGTPGGTGGCVGTGGTGGWFVGGAAVVGGGVTMDFAVVGGATVVGATVVGGTVVGATVVVGVAPSNNSTLSIARSPCQLLPLVPTKLSVTVLPANRLKSTEPFTHLLPLLPEYCWTELPSTMTFKEPIDPPYM